MNTPYRVGQWLPTDQAVLDRWLKNLIEEVDGTEHVDAPDDDSVEIADPPLLPPVQEFKDTVENDAELMMFFHLMFKEVPFNKDPTGQPQVKDYKQMFRLINAIMTRAPEFNETGLVGFPINAILDWTMATTNGYAAYLNGTVNSHFKKVLDYWGEFLQSPESCYVLNTHPRKGWFGEDAMKQMPGFVVQFKCDPTKPYHGYTSWDDFFTREFRDGIRPVAAPDDDQVIVNACESSPYKIQYDVQLRDRFWIKSQKYSLQYMLASHEAADVFVGGTVYQAFLSAMNYHRWHSPVSGTIVKTYCVPGTYYSETLAKNWDPSGPNRSQGYIAEVATRAVIMIEAQNPNIGLMCFLGIGMAEVSTCEITVKEGEFVSKGQQIGMFHFGGSTHCLIFRPGVKVEFDLHGQTPSLHAIKLPVNSLLATVTNSPVRGRKRKLRN